jgi:2-dehydro-3-deoxygalactonokinase
MPLATTPRCSIVLDWGTSSFRALLVDAAGGVADRVETHDGIKSVPQAAFEAVLARAIAPWRAAHGLVPILAAGMIGSRNGWVEMPYVETPAGIADIARAVRCVKLADGGDMLFIPGLTDRSARPFPDVMRGEETQLVGLGLTRDLTAVLPGTHCKWARIENGRIARFRTLVTGEVFETLSRHSFIAQMAKPQSAPDWAAFARGLEAARDPSAGTGLLSRLFSLRTGWLAGELVAEAAGDYLSGLLLGCEFGEVAGLGWFRPGDEVAIIGADALVERYRRAAVAFGLAPRRGPEDAALRGALAVAGTLESSAHAIR